ncbi:MAG: YcnI family protein [Solirubrobacteraceae bacterium]
MRVRAAPIIAGAVAAVLVVTPVAAAHVTLNPREWEAGGFARFAVRVPNERDNAATTEVTLRFPEEVISASFQPVEGWEREVEMAELDEPIDDEGEQITERIDTVTWTGGRIRPGEFQEFGVSFQVPEVEPGTELAFPAIQTYSGGEVVRWIGPPDADEPAPIVAVLEPAPEEEEAPATPAPTPESAAGGGSGGQEEEGGGSDTLSIIALLAGLAGLATGLVAIWRGRRSETAGPRAEATVR